MIIMIIIIIIIVMIISIVCIIIIRFIIIIIVISVIIICPWPRRARGSRLQKSSLSALSQKGLGCGATGDSIHRTMYI